MESDAADRQLASDIHRFVADMPVPLTRRQAMAVELLWVLEQYPEREALQAAPALPSGSPERSLRMDKLQLPLQKVQLEPPRSKGRG